MPTHDSDPAARREPDAPVRVPVNMQDWQLLTFLHWAYDADAVQALLPPGLQVHRWDGRTWIGVIPFRMANVRLPGLPPIPGWRSFAELNVRTYVTGPDGRVQKRPVRVDRAAATSPPGGPAVMSLGVGRTVGRGAQRASSHVKRAIACSSSVGTTRTGIADSGA